MKAKKILAMLLAVTMLFSVTTTVAFAEDVTSKTVTCAAPVKALDGSYTSNVTWTGFDGNVYIAVTEGEDEILAPTEVAEDNYDVTGLAAGKTYSISVADNAEMSEAVTESCFVDVAQQVVDLVLHPSYKSIILRWSPVSCDSYIIERSQDGVNFTKVAEVTDANIKNTKWDGDKVNYKDENLKANVSYSYRVTAVKNGEAADASAVKTAKIIRVIYNTITFKKKSKLTSHAGPKQTITFPKGFTAVADGFGQGKYKFWYKGSYFYASYLRIGKSYSDYEPSFNYSRISAEDFVNVAGLSSKTPYLIWVSTYTQHIYLFKGSKGHWTCVNDWECSTGKAASPTPTGFNKSIKKHMKKHSGIKYWCCFQSMNSIHGKRSSYKIGVPGSHGCVRNWNDVAQYIYNTCKNGTAVEIY